MRRLSLTNVTALGLGLAFLYAPIAILVVYSFNASRLVTVWGGWSTRWYLALLEDRAMIDIVAEKSRTFDHLGNELFFEVERHLSKACEDCE